MCLAHVRRLSEIRPRYLAVSEFDMGSLFICAGGSWQWQKSENESSVGRFAFINFDALLAVPVW